MSSYLNFYLVPQKTTNKYKNGVETEVKLSEGDPILFLSISRASDVYTAFKESLNVKFIGMGDEPEYQELTTEMIDEVISDWKKDIEDTENTLSVNYKMLNNGAKPEDLWEDIHGLEKYLREQKETLAELIGIRRWVSECLEGYNQIEKVLINVD